MKKKILLICALLLLVLLPCGVSAVGNISVNSTPSGATILLDGVSTGHTTSHVIESVTNGSHTVLLQLAGYHDYSQSVMVNDDSTSTVSYSLIAVIPAPTISSIIPSSGFNNGTVSITSLAGTGFITHATVVLTKIGEPNITASNVSVATAIKIICDFGITGKTAGLWTVVVTNPDGQYATKDFEIITPPSTSAPSPIINSIFPTSAVNSGWQTIEIVGMGFSGSTVNLTKTGQSTVTGVSTGSTDTATSLIRNFNLNGIAPGTWNLVILNSDGENETGTFTVNNATAATVTLISPTSGTVNTSVSTTISGTGFVAIAAKIRLYRSGNYIGGSVNSGGTSTQLTGTFNLNQATPGPYEVCVLPDGTEASKTCGPTFTITSVSSTANGSISFESVPSTSKVFLGSAYQGYTPLTLYNITPGSYPVIVQRDGYNDWSDRITVTAGNITYVTARLTVEPEDTTDVTTVPTTIVKTVKTTAKSTVKVPTPWPSATPTPESPVGIWVILCAAVAGFIVLRKR